MQTAIKRYPSVDLEPAIEDAPNNLNTNCPINSNPQQQYKVPVINQPLSPVPDSQSLLHHTRPGLLRAGWKAGIQPSRRGTPGTWMV